MMTRKFLAAAMVASTLVFGGCAVTRDQSTVGQYVDDSAITTQVKARFAENTTVSAMAIKVHTLNGTVQLSGFAKSAVAPSVPGMISSSWQLGQAISTPAAESSTRTRCLHLGHANLISAIERFCDARFTPRAYVKFTNIPTLSVKAAICPPTTFQRSKSRTHSSITATCTRTRCSSANSLGDSMVSARRA